MAATLLGSSTGTTFGCVAETGILITSFSINAQADKSEIRDENGQIKLLSIYNQRAAISVSGTVASSTSAGVAGAAVGVALTLANLESVGGVSTGNVIVDSVTVSRKNDGFKEISVSATRYPGITS